jgi:hypothetical protein
MKYKNLFGLIVGSGIILLTMTSNSLLHRSLSFIGLLTVFYFFISLFINSDSLLQRILPVKNVQNDVLNKESVYKASTAILLLGLILLMVEILRFERVLRPGDFWKTYYALGILISLVLVYLLPHLSANLYSTYKRRYSIFWGILIGMPFIIVSMSSMVNRNFSSTKLYSKEFRVTDQKIKKKRKSNKLKYEITISLEENKSKDLMVKQSLYETVKIGDKLVLTLKDGCLGFELIEEIKKR